MMIFQLDGIALATIGTLGFTVLAALAMLLADAERLPQLTRSGLVQLFGAGRLQELVDLQRALERRLLSPFQLTALRVMGGALGVLVALVLLLVRQPPALALGLGLAVGVIGVVYPGTRYRRGLARADVRAAEGHALSLVVHLRHELTLGTPLERALRSYIEGYDNPLATLLTGVPQVTGADPIAGTRELLRRTESPILLQVAASLGALERARDPRSVLINIQERTRVMLVGQLNQENAAKRLRLLAEVVGLMLLSILTLIFSAIIIRVAGTVAFL
jgi:DNA polymerase III delta prime subunit